MLLENTSRYLEVIGFDGLEKLQKACLLGTGRTGGISMFGWVIKRKWMNE